MPTPNTAKTSDAVIYLPGIMGSELVDASGAVRWGMKPSLLFRQAFLGDVFKALVPRANDGIVASRPIQFPSALPLLSSVEPYTALEAKLKDTIVRSEAVRPFAYDWRRSIADAAAALKPLAHAHLRSWTEQWKMLPVGERRGLPDPQLTLVCHSMGGLVACYFAAFLDDERIVSRIITLGTPFDGSLNAVRALATGQQLPFGAFATALRDAVRTMPGVYELVARWRCVNDGDEPRHIRAADLNGIGANAELAEHARAIMDKLSGAVAESGGIRERVRCLVGTTQPTLQSVRFADGVPRFEESLGGTDYRGDGTVYRYAAVPPEVKPSYLPQSHGAVAKTNEAVTFVSSVLTELAQRPFQAARGVGLRVPDVVKARQSFDIAVLDGEPGLTCQMQNAEDNRLITAAILQKRDDDLVATFTAPAPGLYRIAASGGGFSPVEQLVAAID